MDDPIPDWLVPSWDSFIKKESVPLDLVFNELFDTDLFPLQRKRELRKMMRLIRSLPTPPSTIMEIGLDKCGTLYHWLKAFPSVERVIGVEIRGTPQAELFEKAFPRTKFLWVEASSYDPASAAAVQDFLGDHKLDFLFIDGDKSMFDVDFWLYRPMMSPGGVIAMHDIADNGSPMQDAFLSISKLFMQRGIILDTSEMDEFKRAFLNGAYGPGGSHRITGYIDWLRIWGYTSCGFGYMVAGTGPITIDQTYDASTPSNIISELNCVEPGDVHAQ